MTGALDLEGFYMIKFKGEPFVYFSTHRGNGGPICTMDQYQNGECSYAHLFNDGMVWRFREIIGSANDIEIVSRIGEPEHTNDALLNIRTHPSWNVVK